jgi:3-hydroxyisobutyrate dehydrogenase
MNGAGVFPATGIIGTGHMGGAIARRILAAGHDLSVHDIRPEAVRGLQDLGAAVAPDPQTLARRCDVVLLSLPGHTEVDQAVFGKGCGVLKGLRRGAALVNLTTGSVRQLPRLAELEVTHGVRYVTAPVSQGVDGAERGELSAFAAGTAEAYQAALPVLRVFCSEVLHCGENHLAAMAAKLVTNAAWFGIVAALGEQMVMLVRAGIPREDIPGVYAASCGDSWAGRHDIVSVLKGTYDPSFTLDLACKDQGLIDELAQVLNVPLVMHPVAAGVFRRALDQYGRGAPELYPVRYAEQETGTQLGPEPPGPLQARA